MLLLLLLCVRVRVRARVFGVCVCGRVQRSSRRGPDAERVVCKHVTHQQGRKNARTPSSGPRSDPHMYPRSTETVCAFDTHTYTRMHAHTHTHRHTSGRRSQTAVPRCVRLPREQTAHPYRRLQKGTECGWWCWWRCLWRGRDDGAGEDDLMKIMMKM